MTTVKKVGITTGALKILKLPSFPAGRNQTGGVFTRNGGFDYDIELEQQQVIQNN